ncbi:BTAD domain-containing putative transcriptional regulator [Dactylosporangium sp. NPDC049525]|uniref:AfsR/SARP family transcriptional regulator n=1 Tax=Dactylosporangium sp. NPDC049525 TaxID=3154730 RepID=UPI0034161028
MLGPVELWAHGHRVDLGPRRQRFVLAVLALEANRLVPVDRLIDLAWPDGAPRTAQHAVQVCVSRLRAVLADARDGTGDIGIDTRGDGYALRADLHQVDASRFLDLLERAGTIGDDERRIVALDEALALWSGPALSGAALTATRERLCYRLEEARLTAIEDRFDARLRLGQHRAVLAELADLTHAHPGRERLLGQSMLALYRSGQAQQALAVYQRARVRLAEDVGLDPGAELVRLELAILRNDASLDLTPGPRAGHVTGPLPRQLPPDIPAFTARRRELDELDARLRTGAGGRAPVISAICGSGGVGKTTLAVHWARGVADRFPDGQLYVNLRGFDPTGQSLEPAEAIRVFLDALGVPADRMPAGLEARTGLYRSLLAGKRMLVLLDNARDVEQLRPLLPGEPGCLTVVTSRDQLTALIVAEGAHVVALDRLSPGEAHELLARRLGVERVTAEPDAVEAIIAHCVRLPLALAIAAARAATRPGFPLAAVAAELRHSTSTLDVFQGGDSATDLRAVLSWSYRTLSPAAARLFRLLGLHPGHDIDPAATASLAAVPLPQARRLLSELTRAHMLSEHLPGRYTFHDLLRADAAERVHADGTDARHAAVHRLIEHYLHSGQAAVPLLDARLEPITDAAPRPGVTVAAPATAEEALAWFTTEHGTLLAAVRLAADAGLDACCWQLAWTLTTYLLRRGLWDEHTWAQQAGLAAARRLDDPVGHANAVLGLALGYARAGRFDDARPHFLHALDLFGDLGDYTSQARILDGLAWTAEKAKRPAEALSFALRAADLFRLAGNESGQAVALNTVGWCHAMLGNYDEALAYCSQALTELQKMGNLHGVAPTWHSIGYVHHQLGDHRQALTCYQHSLDACRDLGDRYNEADTLIYIGDTHAAAGDHAAARAAWQESLDIFGELDHPSAADVRARLQR